MKLTFKQTCLLIVLASAVTGQLSVEAKDAAFKPVTLSGWNADVVFENASASAATSFDLLNQKQAEAPLYAWFEEGLQGHSDGLPVSRQIISAADTNVVFQLQPYTTNNVLLLTGAMPSGTLRLSEPAPYRALFLLAAAGGGNAAVTLQLHFSDSTDSDPIECEVPDWWTGAEGAGTKTPAISGLGRSHGKQDFDYEDHGDDAFGLYQIKIDLAKPGLEGKVIQSISFKKGKGGNTAGIFAISGERSKTSSK